MPFIQVDFKAIEVHAPSAARAAGIPLTRMLGGLTNLWHTCWSTEKVFVTRADLVGAFGRKSFDAILEALIGPFLATTKEPDTWRVKGAKRYLRLKAALRRGAEKTNAKRGAKGGKSKRSQADALERRSKASPLSRSPITDTPNTDVPPLPPPSAEESEGSKNFGSADLNGFGAQRIAQAFLQHAAVLRKKAKLPEERPGQGVFDWLNRIILKHGPTVGGGIPAQTALAASYSDFLDWCRRDGLTPGWGLFLSPQVGEYRYDQVRGGELREALAAVTAPAQGSLGFGPLGVAR